MMEINRFHFLAIAQAGNPAGENSRYGFQKTTWLDVSAAGGPVLEGR
jgi:hypothetical protein